MNRWRKERMYGERDTVLWAILSGDSLGTLTVIGSALKEEDADQIIFDHDEVVRLKEEIRAHQLNCPMFNHTHD